MLTMHGHVHIYVEAVWLYGAVPFHTHIDICQLVYYRCIGGLKNDKHSVGKDTQLLVTWTSTVLAYITYVHVR